MRLITVLCCLLYLPAAFSFCGFYVSRADSQLFNKASRVVMMRDDDRTVLTMANDFQGEMKEFAIVIPVPTFIKREQIHIGDMKDIDHLDAYTAPRLVEYFDENPCLVVAHQYLKRDMATESMATPSMANAEDNLGVTIEATYTVGEYDILILSAEQSSGLVTWLTQNGYRLPNGAEPVLGSYLKQGMRFFVAKVNLSKQSKLGFTYLRPLQVAYESPKFMLPVRLGTVNANGPQELFVYTLTRRGRVETTNYRTVRLPTDVNIPVYIKNEFANFYRALFDKQVQKEAMRAVFLEYAWDMGWCDPCAADPLSTEQLRNLGVYWLTADAGQARDVFVTRLHLRYTADTFPDDLRFQETGDRSNFQGRYILQHPWSGNENCAAAKDYHNQLQQRQQQEAQQLANLTGWDITQIRTKMGSPLPQLPVEKKSWWQKIWGD